jgi:uncharacterized phage infection (PIP) family protein YhgE
MDDTQAKDQQGAAAPGTDSASESGQPQAAPGQELLNELTVLADKFAGVVRVAWNSDQRKQIETDVKTGLNSLATSLEDGFKQVSTSPEAKDLQAKATEVGDKVTSSKLMADLTDALKTGLRSISDSLDKFSQEMQEKGASSTPGAGAGPAQSPADPAAKDIPVEKDR